LYGKDGTGGHPMFALFNILLEAILTRWQCKLMGWRHHSM